MLTPMRTTVTLVLGMAALAVMSTTGCAYGEMGEALRTNLASQHRCSALSVRPRNPAHLADIHPEFNGQYIVEGCGMLRTYTCPESTGFVEYGAEQNCTFVEGNANAPTVETAGDEPQDAHDDADTEDAQDAADSAG